MATRQQFVSIHPKILAQMEKKRLKDVLLTGGGIIPPGDMKKLNAMGVGKLFSPGTETGIIVKYIRNWVKTNRKF